MFYVGDRQFHCSTVKFLPFAYNNKKVKNDYLNPTNIAFVWGIIYHRMLLQTWDANRVLQIHTVSRPSVPIGLSIHKPMVTQTSNISIHGHIRVFVVIFTLISIEWF